LQLEGNLRFGGKRVASKSSSEKASGSVISDSAQFLRDSTDELKKVTIPTKQETIQATLVTIVIMLFVALCLFFMDFIFGSLMGIVLS
jgi:preprotein translocase SecE subunit